MNHLGSERGGYQQNCKHQMQKYMNHHKHYMNQIAKNYTDQFLKYMNRHHKHMNQIVKNKYQYQKHQEPHEPDREEQVPILEEAAQEDQDEERQLTADSQYDFEAILNEEIATDEAAPQEDDDAEVEASLNEDRQEFLKYPDELLRSVIRTSLNDVRILAQPAYSKERDRIAVEELRRRARIGLAIDD
jgi:hypothetical protein